MATWQATNNEVQYVIYCKTNSHNHNDECTSHCYFYYCLVQHSNSKHLRLVKVAWTRPEPSCIWLVLNLNHDTAITDSAVWSKYMTQQCFEFDMLSNAYPIHYRHCRLHSCNYMHFHPFLLISVINSPNTDSLLYSTAINVTDCLLGCWCTWKASSRTLCERDAVPYTGLQGAGGL